MADFNAQNTDRENAKAPPSSKARDNDLKRSSRGSLPSIAAEDPTDKRGPGKPVTATRR